MKYEDILQDIIAAAMTVLGELQPGLDERLYENALVLELRTRGHLVDQQRDYPVFYRNHLVGRLIPDLVVDEAVVVDPRVVSALTDTHMAQMQGCLNITGLPAALLLNFHELRLSWRQVYRP